MKQYFDQITEPLLMQSYTTQFFVCFILCLIIILSSGYGFSRRGEVDEAAIQSAHSGFVPRVGGLAIYISILVLIPLLSFGFIPLSVVFNLDAEQFMLLILSAAPVFSFGLAEDLGYNMSPKARLIASGASSLVATLPFKVWLERLGIPVFDTLLMFAPVGILFTIFATVGVVNAFNPLMDSTAFQVTLRLSRRRTVYNLLQSWTHPDFFGFACRCCVGFYGVKFSHGKILLVTVALRWATCSSGQRLF